MKKYCEILNIFLIIIIVFLSIFYIYKSDVNSKQNKSYFIKLTIDNNFSISEQDLNYVLKNNKFLSKETAYQILLAVYKYSKMFNLDPKLILKIIKVESHFNPYAISDKGAKGLMQIMPETFDILCNYLRIFKQDFDIFSIEDNVLIGCFYLRLLIDYSDGDIDKALRKYYAGGYWNSEISLNYLSKIKNEIIE